MSNGSKELYEAVTARGEASQRLRHANIKRLGPFGWWELRRAKAGYNKAVKKVAEIYIKENPL